MPSLTAFKRRAQGHHANEEVFEGLDLRSLSAFGSTWGSCQFLSCRMNMASFQMGGLKKTVFQECQLPMAVFTGCLLEDVSFVSCDLEQASFQGAQLRRCSFTGCRLAYSTFAGATFWQEVAFTASNLHGADLDILQADEGSPVFCRSNLWGVKLAMGCATWNGTMDLLTAQRFVAMVARKFDDEGLKRFAGDQLPVVERLMKGDKA